MPTPTAGPLQAAIVGLSDLVETQGEETAAVAMPVETRIDRPAILGVEGVGAAGEIGAGAEAAARTGEDHCPDIVVAVRAIHRVQQLRQHLAREGVELVRPVQRDGEDVLVLLVLDLLVIHGAVLSSG